MALIPLQIPPGIYRNGTDLQQASRWRDSNLIRWVDNTMKPVGGWKKRSVTAADNKIRGLITWVTNSDVRYIAAGTYANLYAYNAAGTRYDITPTGFTSGREDANAYTGYGAGAYGYDEYGVGRQDITTIDAATTWSLDTWGEYLVACSSDDGKIYEWQTDTAVIAAVLSNAPTNNIGIVVTDERFLFALGAGGDPRKVQWCDKENNNLWTPAATNEAGDILLQTAGNIMCGITVKGQTLIITDIDAHTATYQGPPYVYGFERVGTACGIASKKAVATTDFGALWMGKKAFFSYSGGAVSRLQSDVSDYVFSDINESQISKAFAVTNSRYSEVWWFYPSQDATECNRYVSFNYLENTWAIGQLDRTAGVDQGAFRYPFFASASDNHFYDHEKGFVYDSLTPYAESGPISIGNGDQVACVTEMIPDEKTQGDVNVTFKTRFYPNDVESSHGPFSMSSPTSMRFTGRQIRMRVEGQRLSDWRVGVNRLDIMPGGRR